MAVANTDEVRQVDRGETGCRHRAPPRLARHVLNVLFHPICTEPFEDAHGRT